MKITSNEENIETYDDFVDYITNMNLGDILVDY
jgi:hypothetical protein